MANSNGIITAPVRMPVDLTAVGLPGTSLSAACQSSAINKFARYKPVAYPSITPITEANRRSVAHGIVFPDVVTGSAITGSLVQDAAANDWGYTRPSGGSNSPFRLTDFANVSYPNAAGYNRYAVPPIQCNYPRNGWTFMRGGTSRVLIVYFDLDPSNDTDTGDSNLQATDFVDGGLDLNDWRLVMYIAGMGLYESDDTILNGGEISGNSISVTIPSGTGSYNRNVYIAMYRYSSGRYELLPLPKQGSFNPAEMKLKIIDDAQASGGGIGGNNTEEMFQNVSFSYALDGVWKTAWECTDNGTAKYSLACDGSLYVSMNLTNTSSAAKTIYRQDFTFDMNGEGAVTPTTLYNSSKQTISSFTIPAGSTVTVYMFFDAIFTPIGSDWNTSNRNSSWSMDFTRGGATLFGGDIYAHKATPGWVAR